MKCSCGSSLFGASPIFQTFPGGRCFELASSGGEVKNVWLLRCVKCGEGWVMDKRPDLAQGAELLKAGSDEALKLIDRYTTDGVFSDVEVEG